MNLNCFSQADFWLIYDKIVLSLIFIAMFTYRIHRYQECSLLLQLEGLPVEKVNPIIHALDAFCQEQFGGALKNRVPSYDSLLLSMINAEWIPEIENALIEQIEKQSFEGKDQKDAERTIPVCYDSTLGNDLEKMAAFLGLTTDAIVTSHSSTTYRVCMLGFLPGFPYLGFVPESIAMPRKRQPVPTKAGAVGIAGNQTGIYPVDSPGGWQIVGYTPLKMFDINRMEPALLQPGQRLRFEAINLKKYNKMIADVYGNL